MLCTSCNYRGPMETRIGEYEYRSLPGTILQDVEFSMCPKCGAEAVTLVAIEELDEELASLVVKKRSPLSPDEFRFLRKFLGWSSKDTAKRMGVAAETVSRWEKGKMAIGETADRLLRMFVMFTSPVDDYGPEKLEEIDGEQKAAAPRLKHVADAGWLAA